MGYPHNEYAGLKNQNSEYIRRDYSEGQEVATDLNFTGKVKVPTPTNANDAVTKDYVDRVLNKEYIKDLFPGIKYGQLQT